MNLSGLSSLTTTANSLSNLVLVSPQRVVGYLPTSLGGSQLQQPPALLFHIEGENTTTFTSDITDHWIEDNTAIQDQIALRPVIITVHGFIGELNDISPLNDIPIFGTALGIASSKLTALAPFAPGLSASATAALNTATTLVSTGLNVANSAISTWSSLNNAFGDGNDAGGVNTISSAGFRNGVFSATTGQIQGRQNKQQVMFQQFYGYWSSRALFKVQTPWAIFTDMAIQNVTAVQDESTRVITDFNVSFKQIKTASTSLAASPENTFIGRALSSAFGGTSQGTSAPTLVSPTFGSQLTTTLSGP